MHNHYIDPLAGDILRHRRPSPEVVDKFTSLFSNTRVYHSPSSAMDVYLADLELDSLCFQVGDGATVPTMAWVQKLFKKLTINKCGDQYGPGMLEALEKYIDEYNTECGDICAKVGVTADGENHFVSICSPMMKRIHTHHKSSGEVMFIDSSGSMDNNNARVFVMLTPSVAGGLPIGLLITFSENENVITAALQKWIEILPKHAFYGRGPKQGPKIILSDDHSASRNSLRYCWPETVLLLCIFHVLQAMWRYVWNSEHGVKFEHRAEIYFLFRQILYATSEEEFNSLYAEASKNDVLVSYKIVYDHIKGLQDRGSEWALCFRQHLLTRGHHTNNYCEAAMRILKDKIFDRVRAFNTVQLTDFLVTRLDAHYSRKLAFLVNNRVEGFSRTRYRIKPEKLAPLIATKLSDYDNLYKVVNTEKKTEYVVDADLEVCSCPVGLCGAPCKHQCKVAKTFKLSHHQFLPMYDSTIKAIFYYIMSGKTEVPAGLFKLLKGGSDSDDVIDINNIPEFQQRDSNNNSGDQQPAFELSMEEIVNDAPEDSNSGENVSTEELPKKASLVEMALDLAQRCSNYPECDEPVEKFLKTYWSIVKSKNHVSTLASAFATFGKDLSALKPINHRRSRKIPVQPTAPPRRKVFTGGRKTQVGGRPSAMAYQAAADHGYSQVKKKPSRTYGESWCQPPAKKAKVPHSITKCVDANVRLPK
ncbi:Zinc finger and BTB domain-containing protein 11 [Frankliniella fusca]|uniref:Zinc finger and BTB domain-containing protein 11 n=1 Tax=Frankliniella fusca TaxID=407009 RepID=A0AAE1LAM9_9NEOP|nr:Zinc finger and BTB domain-containing protein 11 [Frankliniella fusca]